MQSQTLHRRVHAPRASPISSSRSLTHYRVPRRLRCAAPEQATLLEEAQPRRQARVERAAQNIVPAGALRGRVTSNGRPGVGSSVLVSLERLGEDASSACLIKNHARACCKTHATVERVEIAAGVQLRWLALTQGTARAPQSWAVPPRRRLRGNCRALGVSLVCRLLG